MKTLFTIAITIFTLVSTMQSDTSISIEELKALDQTEWVGELMYINYGDGRVVILKTKMQIEIKKDKIIMQTQYINEPSANSKSSIKLKKNGTYFGDEKIIEKTISESGLMTFITEYEGRDANKPAKIIKTYVYDNTKFSVTKEVQFEGASERFVRNAYTYEKQ